MFSFFLKDNILFLYMYIVFKEYDYKFSWIFLSLFFNVWKFVFEVF